MNSSELILFITLLGTALAYGTIILFFSLGWSKLPGLKGKHSPKTQISVIIPLRNESEHLPGLIEKLLLLDYPQTLYEVILINDHSTDDTSVHLGKTLNIENIHSYDLPPGMTGKKQALAFGISRASGELILTSDADCKPGSSWLKTIDAYIQEKDYKMLAGPVSVEKPKGWLGIFQAIEFISLQGSGGGAIGIGKPIMCNGANLAFLKSAFNNVGGYTGNENIAGGDDIFLMEKFKKVYGPESIGFMKDESGIVNTSQAPNLRAYVTQRIRWVAKSPSYRDPFLLVTSFTVLLFNLTILISLVYAFLVSSYFIMMGAIAVFLYKSVIDFPLLYMASGFFDQRKLLSRNYLLIQPFYILFIVFSGIFGNILSYKWKDRKAF